MVFCATLLNYDSIESLNKYMTEISIAMVKDIDSYHRKLNNESHKDMIGEGYAPDSIQTYLK
jgi:hypothetical protein